MNLSNNLYYKKKLISSWNETYAKKAIIFYPKNLKELKNLLKSIKNNKKTYIIRTGTCAYDSKSINPDDNTYVITLKYFDKIIKISLNKKNILVECGAKISDVVKYLKSKNFSLFSVPGGENISVGGAISANVIGKDSCKKNPSFGDAVEYLEVLSENGKITKINKNNKKMNNYIGAFGMSGIIIRVKLKIKKIKSPNLNVSTVILNNLTEIKKEFEKKFDYNYIQVDPFFRKTNFAVSIRANYIQDHSNLYKNINLKPFKIEQFIFYLFSFFINYFTWQIFYKLFFIINKNRNYFIDLHNFHYNSKYKHMVPLICRGGLVDYEVLIKNKFQINLKKIINFLKKNKLYPIYIIIKRTYGSKKKFYYQFNDTGFTIAISLDKKYINKNQILEFENLIKKNKLKINLSKTDSHFIGAKKNINNNLFLSLYKKMLLNKHELSR